MMYGIGSFMHSAIGAIAPYRIDLTSGTSHQEYLKLSIDGYDPATRRGLIPDRDSGEVDILADREAVD